jgi:glycosyltransferase involved in cell wall biosynthesis
MNKHILVVSQYFYPENFRINDMCEEWFKRGYEVTVLTGIPNYPQGKFYKGYGFYKRRKEVFNGVNVIRIPIIPRGKGKFTLIINYYSFVISGWFWKLFTRIKADLVFVFEVSPMTQALPGIWYAKNRKIPCYLYVTDLWPESVEFATGLKNRFIINSIQNMVDIIYKKSTKILTSSRGFIKPIQDRGVSIDKIEYWPQYPESIYQPVHTNLNENILLPQDGVFNITFAGNIGYSQGLSVLVETATLLKKNNLQVRFNIIGDGRYKGELINLIRLSSTNEYFNFIDRKAPIEIPKYLSVSDAAFISLNNAKVFEYTLPSKLQSYLACGIPILASANGELEKIIIESGSGFCSPAGNYVELANNIIKLMNYSANQLDNLGINAINYCKKNFDKNELLNRLDELFSNK